MSRPILATSVLAVLLSMSGITAARQTAQPGQMTPARIWVENRGKSQAVPVDLRDANLERPLKVYVTNGESGDSASPPLQTRVARQAWDYDTVVIPSGSAVPAALTARGAAGWEAVGIVNTSDDGAILLLKRPR